MKIKILHGTQPDRHLCTSCCAAIVRQEGNREVTVCREMPGQHPYVHGRVTQCSAYVSTDDHRAMAQYRGQAWHLDMDEDGNPCWKSPEERKNPRVTIRTVRRRANAAGNPPPPPPDIVQ